MSLYHFRVAYAEGYSVHYPIPSLPRQYARNSRYNGVNTLIQAGEPVSLEQRSHHVDDSSQSPQCSASDGHSPPF